MPLTGAEKTRRYRERLKAERPDEYKAQCKRNLEKMKVKKKKISEMSRKEKEEQRKKWREEKRKSNVKKNKITKTKDIEKEMKVTNVCGNNEKLIFNLRNKCKILVNKCRKMTLNIQKLQTQKEKLKKRNQRLRKQSEQRIKEIEKMQARHEVLECSLKTTYKHLKTHKDKKIMKKFVDNSKNKKYVSQVIGLVGTGRTKKPKVRRIEIKEITDFFIKDSVSRITSGRRETRTKNKDKKQIRYLVDSLVNLYQKYRCEGGKYGFTTFYNHKPFYVLSAHLNSRDTCLCVKHSNIKFQHTALKQAGAITKDMKAVLNDVVCDTNNYLCMQNQCDECSQRRVQYNENTEGDLNVSWFRWESLNHTYIKKNGNEKKEITTKKTEKMTKSGNLDDLKNSFEQDVRVFKKHHYNMEHQHKQFQIAVSQLKENEAVVVCDFSENYQTKLASEIQSMHFGASKKQITLHTGMIYWQDRTQSFCTIAEDNNHQPAAIWAHLEPIIKLIKTESTTVTIIHFFTDGPSSQYRQKNNFYLFAHYTKIYGWQYATWSYFEAGHGKNVADGIGGSVKRMLDRKVSQGTDVANAKDAYDVLKRCLKITKVFLIPENSIDAISNILPQNVKPLIGTLQVHQIITQSDEMTIKYRNVSCFCGPTRGKCSCFSPATHIIASRQDNPSISATTTRQTQLINKKSKEMKKKVVSTSKETKEIEVPKESKNANKVLKRKFELVNIELKPPKKISNTENNIMDKTNAEELNLPRSSQIEEVTEIFKENKSPNTNLIEEHIEPLDGINILSEMEFPVEDSKHIPENNCLQKLQELELFPALDLESIDDLDINELSVVFLSDTQSKCTFPIENKKFHKKKISQGPKSITVPTCNKCSCSILSPIATCMVCKKMYCDECTDGITTFDYICDICLTTED